MNADKAFSVLGAIVTLGMVTVIVSHPQSAKIITATGRAFSNAVRAGMGR